MSRFLRTAAPIMLAAMLSLSACNGSVGATAAPAPLAAISTTPAPTRTPQPTSTPQPTNTPTPTSTPTPISGAACLVGEWQVEDLSSYLASLTAQTSAQAQVLSESGPVTYRFDAQGTARLTADQFALKLKVPVRGLPLNLVVTIDGEATAGYTADSNQLAFSNAQLDGLKVSARLGKQELFAGTPAGLAEMFGVSLDPLFKTSTYSCRADTLKYTPPLQNASEVALARVQ